MASRAALRAAWTGGLGEVVPAHPDQGQCVQRATVTSTGHLFLTRVLWMLLHRILSQGHISNKEEAANTGATKWSQVGKYILNMRAFVSRLRLCPCRSSPLRTHLVALHLITQQSISLQAARMILRVCVVTFRRATGAGESK